MEKARIKKNIRSAPQMILQKLCVFSNWLSGKEQAKELLTNISYDSSKIIIVIKSPGVHEDSNHLKENNDFMKFFEQKYDRPEEIVILRKKQIFA